ncbi:hypothetical protein GY45DRAFT_417931 [Cubamyces sp. BRFM 1775]|nr:hypothetical protein GY45DRAFT_417931 [Cubamyces sp. BRFM 1775]
MGSIWSRLRHLWWRPDALAEGEAQGSPLQTSTAAPEKDVEPPSGPGKMELRLMMETKPGSPTEGAIEVDGKSWMLSDPIPDIESETLTPYLCVSYVWGSGRVPNPVHPSILMSDRTLRTFTAVTRCLPGKPIWMDAFSVPVERMAKRATLESLGFVFWRAEAVVAVLRPESIAAIEEMEVFMATKPRPAVVPDAPLAALEADEWIRSVWTYQEIVNSKSLWFVSEARDGAPAKKAVDGQDLLNVIGAYINHWEAMPGKAAEGIRSVYPHADNFQELLLDYRLREYACRSALQIMYGMNHRASVTPENHFYSMIGALTKDPSSRATKPTIELLAERFMELCEEKGDYSFIFCAAPRDPRPGLRWKPIPCIFPSILAGHISGEGLPGKRVDGGVSLSNVLVLSIARESHCNTLLPNEKLRTYLQKWLKQVARYHGINADGPEETLVKTGYECLRLMEFDGVGDWYTSDLGVFYPQDELSGDGEVSICVSLAVSWRFGAPALATFTGVDGEKQYVLGVFVGPVEDIRRQGSKDEFLLM